MNDAKASKLPRLLSARELAETTGIPRTTWYDIFARGEVPVVRVGAGLRVAEPDIARWIESRREGGSA